MNFPLEMPPSLLLTAERAQVANAEWTPNCSLLQPDEVNASPYGSRLKVESGHTSREFVQQIREVTKANWKLFWGWGNKKLVLKSEST